MYPSTTLLSVSSQETIKSIGKNYLQSLKGFIFKLDS